MVSANQVLKVAISLPATRTEQNVANWVELELLFSESESLSLAEVVATLADDLGNVSDWPGLALNDDFDQSFADDEIDSLQLLVERSFMVLEARCAHTGDRYPISSRGDMWSIEGTWRDHLEYAFLAALHGRVELGLAKSMAPSEPSILFERLVANALANYLGGDALRFGAPDFDLSGSFLERVAVLARSLNERPIPEPRIATPQKKDFGLDVAAWRHFDSRSSSVVVLCQCGIGSDFEGKTLPAGRWPKLIDFTCSPLTALAIPFQDNLTPERWLGLAVDSGLLLDRVRIARFASLEPDTDLHSDITSWVSAAIPVLSA